MDDEWTLDDLQYNAADPDAVPSLEITERLIDEYHVHWLDENVQLSNVIDWVCTRFELEVDDFKWDTYDLAFKQQMYMNARLRLFLKAYGIHSGATCDKVFQVECVLYNVRDLLVQATRFMNNLDPRNMTRRIMMPPEARGEDQRSADNENVIINDASKNTPFQNAFLHLRQVLETRHYRRADGKFFKRIILNVGKGMETLAFEEECTIEQFIIKETSVWVNFQVWRWMTHNETRTTGNMADYLKKFNIPEAPELEENQHLRSYAGDPMGRGSGVYDSSTDAFFPYHMQEQWSDIAARVTAIRRQLTGNAKYTCTPPSRNDVCVVHLNTEFPYDILEELLEVVKRPLGMCWRVAHEYECTHSADEINDEDFGQLLHDKLPTDVHDEPEVWGMVWQEYTGKLSDDTSWTELQGHDVIHEVLRSNRMHITEDEFCKSEGPCITSKSYLMTSEDTVLIPLRTPSRRARIVLPADCRHDAHAFSFVRFQCADGSVRYFRPHIGRTWMDCDASEIDHIYNCQMFTVADIFMLYAMKGRLFFEVGEKDNLELTLFIEGVGGCGKSTILKTQQKFWPQHLIGTLSANMQPQFGMSAVAKQGKAKVIFCNEMNAEPNCTQEEWQTSCSGEWGSYAVKFKDPIVLKWIAQHFWVGNSFPLRWKNREGQVSRRIAGVLMEMPVKPRDGRIVHRMLDKLGSLERKEVLAYFEFLRIWGTTDPMSVPESLPPAFYKYHRKSRRATDPIEDFLSEGTFVQVVQGGRMSMDLFKEFYGKYRIKYDLGKAPRWGPDLYRTPFRERGLEVITFAQVNIAGEGELKNVDVIINLTPVEEDE